jgi:DNA-binding NarL/FixJ family response regulator
MNRPHRRTSPASRTDGSRPSSPVISVVLIEDNRLLREGLEAMIRAREGFRILASSSDAETALRTMREAAPDVVLVDFGLEDYDSLSLTATVRTEVPKARVIVMGILPLQEDVANFVQAGACGFIMKDASFDEFFATIRAVAQGAEVLPPALTNTLFSQIAHGTVSGNSAGLLESVRLTGRERQVVELLSEGLSNKEIAVRLQIAVHTVKSHVHNVLEKLALRSRLEVAAYTHARGMPKADPH